MIVESSCGEGPGYDGHPKKVIAEKDVYKRF